MRFKKLVSQHMSKARKMDDMSIFKNTVATLSEDQRQGHFELSSTYMATVEISKSFLTSA